MAVPLSDPTRARLEALFDPADVDEARELLVEDCADNLPFCADHDATGLERIRFAALEQSRGTLEGLVDAIALAATDWRDLLVAAGFANDVRAHLAWWPDADAGRP